MNETNSELLVEARKLDAADPLASFRQRFHLPTSKDGSTEVYLVGNSLGLQPIRTAGYVQEELEKWRQIGVRGHFESEFPWMPYHEFLTESMARIVGAVNEEVVMMNSLSANLHFMMATFYRPEGKRRKILIENHAFPSDHFAVESQIKFHGGDPQTDLLLVGSEDANQLVEFDAIEQAVQENSDQIALILLPGVQYYTGQRLDMQRITELAHRHGIVIGYDLAHAVGNVPMDLHDWDVDFAVWCSYKYLNSGPGSVGGCFVHQRHATDTEKIRFSGWWGHDKQTRFLMKNEFRPIPTAEGWQLSNPPILSLAAIRASLDEFSEAGFMEPLRNKSLHLTSFLEDHLQREFANEVSSITPKDAEDRGCQLSLRISFESIVGKDIHQRLEEAGVRCDWREPDVIRVAPAPLYNSFEDVARFILILKQIQSGK